MVRLNIVILRSLTGGLCPPNYPTRSLAGLIRQPNIVELSLQLTRKFVNDAT